MKTRQKKSYVSMLDIIKLDKFNHNNSFSVCEHCIEGDKLNDTRSMCFRLASHIEKK